MNEDRRSLRSVREASREQVAQQRGRSEGLVSDFRSKASLRVGGQLVDATAAVFKEGSEAQLGNGKRVVVEGQLVGSAPSVLSASVLRFID